MQFAREMDSELADKFIGMYVNKWTLGYGEKGRQAVKELIVRGTRAGFLPVPPGVEFLSAAMRVHSFPWAVFPSLSCVDPERRMGSPCPSRSSHMGLRD